jgi:predicted nucleotidyltransferase
MEDGTRKIFEFSVDPDVGDSFYRFVHPRRQMYLKSILESLPKSVDELWIFGSAVTPNHFSGSDLDIMLIGDDISDDDIMLIYSRISEVAKIDTWNKCPNCDLLWKSRAEFDEWKGEWGHCFWNIAQYGVKYFDRRWADGQTIAGNAENGACRHKSGKEGVDQRR